MSSQVAARRESINQFPLFWSSAPPAGARVLLLIGSPVRLFRGVRTSLFDSDPPTSLAVDRPTVLQSVLPPFVKLTDPRRVSCVLLARHRHLGV